MKCMYCGKDKPPEVMRTSRRCKACWHIYYREWYGNNRDKQLEYKTAYNASTKGRQVIANSKVRNAEKRKTRVAVMLALRRGDMTKPERCVACRAKKPVEGHHIDYDKPTEVIWLCRNCHQKLHRTVS